MQWYDKTFNELKGRELFGIYKLRATVFNTEQNSAYCDPDDNDLRARHVFGVANGQVIAYTRYFTVGDHLTFGRVVIAKKNRGQGMGTLLMEHVLRGIKEYFPGQEIIIHAQVPVVGYYRKFNFTSFGAAFIEAGRKHIQMKHSGL